MWIGRDGAARAPDTGGSLVTAMLGLCAQLDLRASRWHFGTVVVTVGIQKSCDLR